MEVMDWTDDDLTRACVAARTRVGRMADEARIRLGLDPSPTMLRPVGAARRSSELWAAILAARAAGEPATAEIDAYLAHLNVVTS